MTTYLELEEAALFEKVATNVRGPLLIRLLSHPGCRISEALVLRVGEIDLQGDVVTIQNLKRRIRPSCPNCSVRL